MFPKISPDLFTVSSPYSYDATRIIKSQGVSYSQKLSDKCSFPNLDNSRTSKFVFPKYLTEYQNAKIVKSKFKSEKSKKNKDKNKCSAVQCSGGIFILGVGNLTRSNFDHSEKKKTLK